MTTKPRLLCVDDEQDLLDGLRLSLRKSFVVEVAASGADGLAVFEGVQNAPDEEGFAAVVSDMRMPGMNGAEFLTKIMRLSPATPRILLSGQADLESTIEAINEARIFRFLTKPCEPSLLIETVNEAVELARLRDSERVLLDQTLRGTVSMLTDVLGLVSTGAYSRTMRVREIVAHVNASLHREPRWELDMAALLSQIGCVVVPEDADGRPQPSHAEAAANLLQQIPRLDAVAAIVRRQNEPGPINPDTHLEAWTDAELNAEMLRCAVAFDAQLATGASRLDAATQLTRSTTAPPSFITAALLEYQPEADVMVEALLHTDDFLAGMQLLDDLHASSGVLLAGGGTTLTAVLIERIRSFAASVGIDQPIAVMAPRSSITRLRVSS